MSRLQDLAESLRRRTESEEFRTWLSDFLVRICQVDTSPRADVALTAANEQAVYDLIEAELADAGGTAEYRPIDPGIQESPHFSKLYYTQSPEDPEGLSFDAAYADRRNLLYVLAGSEGAPATGRRTAVNAHIDVVKPYFPPEAKGDAVYGRGSCDDKGAIASMVACARLLRDLRREEGVELNHSVTFMFVTDEETGGNGSLSVAMDGEVRRLYDSIMVLECAANKLHPANRGAVWYKTVLHTAGCSKLEAISFCVLAMEDEGAKIKSESAHPLFPQRPVQTCHGILQAFGEHPSRINGEIPFLVSGDGIERADLAAVVAAAVEEYTAVYGDKTQVIDAETGKPKVETHYEITDSAEGFEVRVYGSTGHMGAILENDCAITKMAYIVRALSAERAQWPGLTLVLPDDGLDGELVLEGGQGFLPTHPMAQVMARMRDACQRGLEQYLRCSASPGATAAQTTTYDKLHNAAYDGDPDSPSMRNGIAAMRALGMWPEGEPVQGWTVSCDARLFANLHPDLSVLTTGAGELTYAHSDGEHVQLSALRESIRMISLFLLLETGTVATQV